MAVAAVVVEKMVPVEMAQAAQATRRRQALHKVIMGRTAAAQLPVRAVVQARLVTPVTEALEPQIRLQGQQLSEAAAVPQMVEQQVLHKRQILEPAV